MVSRDGRPFLGHIATAISTAFNKTSPQRHPQRPCLLLPYKRAGRGLYMGAADNGRKKTSHLPTIEDQHLKQSPLYFHFLSETWDRFPLSQLVTPTQALRCKEIQYSSLPARRRVFFCPNQDKPPCTLLASLSRLGTRSIDSLVGLGPSLDQTPIRGTHRIIIWCTHWTLFLRVFALACFHFMSWTSRMSCGSLTQLLMPCLRC
jgi:hypothetical protein